MQLTNSQKPQTVNALINLVSACLVNPDREEAQDILDGLQMYLREENSFPQNSTLRTLIASAEEAVEDIIIAEDN